jgi:hypothetical protein
MASKDQIKKAILEVAGNPESGVVRDLVDAWVAAIVAIDEPVVATPSAPAKETRVVKADEVR